MEEKKKKIYHVKEARKSLKISKISAILTYGLWFSTYLTLPKPYDIPFLLLYIGSIILKGKYEFQIYNSQEMKKFKQIYKDILERYLKLNNSLEFNSAIDIYTLYDFAITNNLFSSVKTIDRTYTRFDSELLKELSLNNHGVCRHMEAMLVDIYQQLGYESCIGVCYRPDIHQKIIQGPELSEEEKQKIIEEIKNAFQLEINGEIITPDKINITTPMQIITEEAPGSKMEKKSGNHTITIVNDDNYSYYFDSSNSGIFVPTEKTNIMIDENGTTINMIPKHTTSFNNKHGIKVISSKPQRKLEDMVEEACIASDIILDNLDMVEKFYKDIHEPLQEAEELYRLILK